MPKMVEILLLSVVLSNLPSNKLVSTVAKPRMLESLIKKVLESLLAHLDCCRVKMELKRKITKPKKFPETALAFFIKLYCKQKGSSDTKFQSKLIEATKSWLSLTEEQKEQVYETYKEKEQSFKLICFDQLKNAEPFMKVKDPTGLKSSSSVIEPEVQEEHANQIVNDEDIQLGCHEELVTDIEPEHDEEHHNEAISDIVHLDEEIPRTFVIEPVPPTFKTSKDLYHMLNPVGGTDSVSWTTLSSIEKKQYTRAVTLLKTGYITKYREYLESLTPRELFDYYNKKMFS